MAAVQVRTYRSFCSQHLIWSSCRLSAAGAAAPGALGHLSLTHVCTFSCCLCAGADSAEEQLQIELPAVLQKQLLDQYDAIHDEGKLLQLPRRPNVMQAGGGWGAVCGWDWDGHSGRVCLTVREGWQLAAWVCGNTLGTDRVEGGGPGSHFRTQRSSRVSQTMQAGVDSSTTCAWRTGSMHMSRHTHCMLLRAVC